MSKKTNKRNTTNEVVNQTAEVKRQQEEEVVISPAGEVAVETQVEEPVEKVETPAEKAEVPAEEVEAPAEEAEVPAEEVEAPAEEAEVPAKEVEAPAEEAEVPAEEVEAPAEEVEVPAEEVEAPAEEVEASEEEAEAPEEKSVSKEEELSKENDATIVVVPVTQQAEEKESFWNKVKKGAKKVAKKVVKPVIAVVAAGGLILGGCALSRCSQDPGPGTETTDTTQETVATLPTIELEQFEDSVNGVIAGIAKNEADEAYSNMQVEKIGKEQVQKWVDKYGELPTQQAIAQFIAFASEIEMQRYIANEGLQYNPNAEDDYNDKLNAADAVYRAAQGKNPDGTLMTLPNYDDYKSSREAMKKLIMDSGDMDLYVWYVAKTDGYDLMMQQIRDTKKALEYKETVKLQLLESKGVADILELQLKKVSEGTLVVMDPVTYKYTSQYRDFILANWIYILAK